MTNAPSVRLRELVAPLSKLGAEIVQPGRGKHWKVISPGRRPYP